MNWSEESRREIFPESAKENKDRVFAESDTISFFDEPNSNESKKVIQLIQNNISKISDTSIFDVQYDNSVENYQKKTDYVLDIFKKQGEKAYNKSIGYVDLSKSGAKSTIMHGFGKNKLAVVPVIKNVIENGDIIEVEKNYNNTGITRYIIAGKGKISGKNSILAVVVKSYPKTGQTSKFYLHEAEIIKVDLSSMTAPQLSVDTVNKSTLIDTTISQDKADVNTYNTQKSENDAKYLSAVENGDMGTVYYNP